MARRVARVVVAVIDAAAAAAAARDVGRSDAAAVARRRGEVKVVGVAIGKRCRTDAAI